MSVCETLRNQAAYLLRQMAGTIWRVENFVVKHREIEGQAQADWVSWSKFEESNVLHTSISVQ